MLKRYKPLYVILSFLLLPLMGSAQTRPSLPKWVAHIGGRGTSSISSYIRVDLDDNVYITGIYMGTVDFDPSAGFYNLTSVGDADVFIAKYDPDGALLWARSVGGIGLDQPNGMSVNGNGSVTITGLYNAEMDANPGVGVFNLTPTGGYDMFVINIDLNGSFLWGRSIGGSGADFGNKIQVDKIGNRFMAGQYEGQVQAGPLTFSSTANIAGLLIKFDASGNVQWGMSFGNSGDNKLVGVDTDDSNNIIISGTFSGAVNFNPRGVPYNLVSPGTASYIAKYDPDGQLMWVRIITGNSSTNICVDKVTNGIYATGGIDGSITFAPGQTIVPQGPLDIFIAKYDANGVFQWGKDVGGGGASVSNNGIAVKNDEVYISGYFSGSVDFDGSAATDIKNFHGQRDHFLLKYNTSGNYQWAITGGSSTCNNTLGRGVDIDSKGDILFSGAFCSTINFDVSGCSDRNMTALGIRDVFLAKYTPMIVGLSNNIITAPAVTSFCGNADPDVIKGGIPIGGNGTYNYQWQRSTDNISFTNISGAATPDLDLSVITTTGYYRRVVTSGQCVTPSNSNVVQLTVQTPVAGATNTITAPPIAERTFCGGGDAAVITGSSITGTYQWQTSVDGTVFTDITGATSKDFDPPYVSVTTYYRRIVTSVGCVADQVSNIAPVVIGSAFDNNTISPLNTVTCDNTFQPTLSSNTPPTGPGDIIIQWQIAGADMVFSDIPGANNVSYQPPVQQGTRYYRRVLTSSACAGKSVSDVASVTLTDPVNAVVTQATPGPICEGGSVQLTASGGTTYKWTPATGLSNPNIADPLASPTMTTTYTVQVSTGQCADTVTVTVTVIPRLQAVDAGPDKQITEGDITQLKGRGLGGGNVTYSWSPSTYLSDPTVAEPVASPPSDITYTLTVTGEQGCFTPLSDVVNIKVTAKIPVIVIPNSFTPNGDGINDLWEIPALSNNTTCLVNIFTRNGTKVYTGRGYARPWDGRTDGRRLPHGTYYYTIDLQNGEKPRAGWVAILR